MKRVISFLTAMILAASFVSAIAVESMDGMVPERYMPDESVYVEYPIWPESIEAWQDEGILLAGRVTGKTKKFSTGSIMLLDASGKSVWKHRENDLEAGTVYWESMRLNDETIVSLLIENQNDYARYIELIYKDGTINRINSKELLPNVRRLFVNKQGVLAVGDSVTDRKTYLVQMDERGDQLWKLELDNNLIFYDMLQDEGSIYLFGTESEIMDAGETYRGLIIAIDENGKCVWQQTDSNYQWFTDGCLMGDGRLLLSGVRADLPHNSGVCCIAESGIQWDTILPEHSTTMGDINLKMDLVDAVIPYKDDYLIACKTRGVNGCGAWLFRMDAEGIIADVGYVFTDRIYTCDGCDFLNLKDDAYLLCHGMVAEAGQAEIWNERGIGSYGDPNRGFYLVKIDW